MRCFIGIDFAGTAIGEFCQEIAAELAEHCGIPRLDERCPPHLTLVPPLQDRTFPEDVRSMGALAKGFAHGRKPFEIEVSDVCFFSDGSKEDQMCYLAVARTPPVRELMVFVTTAADMPFGHRMSVRDVSVPHISLARHLSSEQVACIPECLGRRMQKDLGSFTVEAFTLFVEQDGRYEAQAVYPLDGA